VPLLGRDHVVDRAGGLRFRISFGSFYQVNRHADRLLYEPAMRMLGDVRGCRAVDGYGGVGTFGLRLWAAGAASVAIVEANPVACHDAAASAAASGAENVTVVEAPFAAAPPAGPADVLVVDPPRAGLLEGGCARVLELAAPRVLYVACSTAALRRDLDRLVGAGRYRVAALHVADLFPHTEHVETLCLLAAAP
jgi:23S rRNA (uracil1939-C5)-methyltransferase